MSSPRLYAPTADFGFNLLRKEAAANRGKNVFISPTSISIALGMTAHGAVGTTQSGMYSALGMEYSGEHANLAYSNLLAALNGKDLGVELAIANAIWAQKGRKFVPSFLAANREHFKATVKVADFSAPKTLDDINDWVRKETRDKIDGILDEISPEKIMFLLSASYFKGQFRTQFDPKLTTKREFRTAMGKREHDIMFRRGDVRYAEDKHARLVALPFGDSDRRVNLYFLLPQPGADVNDVVNALNGNLLGAYFQALAPREAHLYVPKFEVDYDVKLNDSLIALGMSQAFDQRRADFSKLHGGAYIAEVKHKTFGRVDEVGAEAAAVTSVGMGLRCAMPRPPFEFNVNSPFVALIADENSGALLFAGVVNDPKAVK